MHPSLYSGVSRQISRSTGGELQAPESAAVLLSAVARDLFRNDITWGKVSARTFCLLTNVFGEESNLVAVSQVVSMFSITAGLAVDCVRQGHPEFLPKLIEGVADVIEDELATWINENGGWVSLEYC